jgi:glycosyltransferase involved in cell wall biosynthesis
MRFVLAVSGWYLGGIVTFCANLSAGLRQKQHEVTLLCGSDGPLPQPDALKDLFDGCTFVPRGISSISTHVRKYVREIEQLKPDVLVINDSSYVMAALPFLNRAIIRTPILHSALPWEGELGLSNEQWWDRVIGVSPSTLMATRARGLRDRASVCPVGVPLPAANGKAAWRLGTRAIRIISVGRIVVRDKRMDRLPTIAKALAERNVDFCWTVLGDGGYLPTLRRDLERLGVLRRFSLRGSAAPATVAEALRESDVLVMPSDSEGTPHALLEAMAHAVVPVVSRIDGSTTCIIEHNKSGYLCEPSDPAAFAAAIADLAAKPARLRELGRHAANAIAMEFSLEAFTNRFLAVIDEIRARAIERPDPLPITELSSGATAFRCLGFWRCVRTETLGRLKRWLQGRRMVKAAGSGALLPSL